MAQLAIKGHKTRGKEIIQLLEMLGGVNKYQIGAIRETYVYFVDENGIVRLLQINQLLPEQYIVYSLEEFEEKFPYKVGNKVIYHTAYGQVSGEIIGMEWDGNTIQYTTSNGHIEPCVLLQPYKEEENYCQVIGNDTSSNGVNTSASSIIEETIDKTKFPYEIGTRVSVKGQYIEKLATIVGLSYNSCACMQYEIQFDDEDVVIHYPTNLMTPIITEQSMEEKDEKSANHIFDTEIISFDIAQRDKYELDLQGKFEVVLREGKYYVERIKPQYPKDYEECFNICFGNKHHIVQVVGLDGLGDNKKLFESFIKLKICRDAYWKIAGKKMGLDKPWKQDYDDRCFIIANNNGNIHTYEYHGTNNIILAFPTEEMRDTFFENFKDLINECKELL